MGKSKWDELVRMEGSIRKSRQETLYKQRQRRRKFVEVVAWIVMGTFGVGLLFGFVLFLKGIAANAETWPEYVTCRLKGCSKIDGEKLCIYHGPNNTVDNVWMNINEYYPREIQCKYDPKHEKPPTLRETFEAIEKSRK
jgi:hypothetical protein